MLQVIEAAMATREFVPREQVAKYSKLDLKRDTDYRLRRLDKLGLIYSTQAGYTINYAGYDCLAINALMKAGIIEAFGKPLGVGKEADVYDALNPRGDRVAVKFHRLGRISFRQTMRKRGYAKQHTSWLFQSRLAAEKEYKALKLVFPHGVAVPEPICQNRHVVVMGMIDGVELAKCRQLDEPEKMLAEILDNLRKTYLAAGIVHGDLSEYNIIAKPDNHILIIDWPQYVPKTHPNATQLLTRDVQNVLRYFQRKHKLSWKLEESLEYVTGQDKSAA